MSVIFPVPDEGLDLHIANEGPVRPLLWGVPEVTQSDVEAVDRVLRSGWLGCGPEVERFEADLAAATGAPSAVVVSSATAALTIGLHLCGVGPGDEVITSALTFTGTANAIGALGARPVFVDLTPRGTTLDPEAVAVAVTSRTRAILPVAWRGEPTDTITLRTIAARNDLALIEDGACALGSGRHDPIAPSPDCLVAVSFHPTKVITAGLGGALLGLSPDQAEEARRIRSQGVDRAAWHRVLDKTRDPYQAISRGYALEMSDLHATLGRSQLARLDSIIARRRGVFALFEKLIPEGLGILPPNEVSEFGTVNASMFSLLLPAGVSRLPVRAFLSRRGIGTGVHYPLLTDQPAWREMRTGPLPVATHLSSRTLTLPSQQSLSEADVAHIADSYTRAVSEDLIQ